MIFRNAHEALSAMIEAHENDPIRMEYLRQIQMRTVKSVMLDEDAYAAFVLDTNSPPLEDIATKERRDLARSVATWINTCGANKKMDDLLAVSV